MSWDTIVIGSGFGGTMAAHALVSAGERVLMLERGGWVARGPESWGARGAGLVTAHYDRESPYDVVAGGRRYRAGAWHCVGGQSVFYGGASYRFRESDFQPDPELLGASEAAWPFTYDDIEPFYSMAEGLLGVAGAADDDPTAPWRSAPYAQSPAPLSPPAARVAAAAGRLGLTPSRIPLAISYERASARRACVRCGTCDGYACAAEAKNDLASCAIPSLVARGMELRTNTVCVRLVRRGTRIAEVEVVDRVTGAFERLRARRVVLAAGTLATPHLLLASGLEHASPAPDAVGRYLTRHRNVVVFGVWPRRPNPERVFDKQVAILDFYREGGSIQQMTPPVGLVRAYLPPLLRDAGALLVSHSSGLLVIAEDEPRLENGVQLDPRARDRYGLPRLCVHQAYTARDERVAAVLARHASRVLREAGARVIWKHQIETFSHALGTVRMGRDPRTAPLDGAGRFRGLDNLYVTDGSALPRSAGVNPSLTIAANALRIGHLLAGTSATMQRQARRRLPLITSPSHPAYA